MRSPHRKLASGSATLCAFLVPVAIAIFPADISFVCFHDAAERLVHIASHRSAPAHAHEPACVVIVGGFLAEDHAMDLKRADSLFAGQHQVSDFEPEVERNLGILEDRFAGHAETIAVALVTVQNLAGLLIDGLRAALANPVIRTRRECIDFLARLTARAAHAIRPAHLCEECAALFIGPELSIEVA